MNSVVVEIELESFPPQTFFDTISNFHFHITHKHFNIFTSYFGLNVLAI